MINAISKKEYTGSNFDTLMLNGADEGQEFATFKQMIKYLKCSGKDLKGLKKFATLFFMKEVENEKGETEKVRRFFSVFSVEEASIAVKCSRRLPLPGPGLDFDIPLKYLLDLGSLISSELDLEKLSDISLEVLLLGSKFSSIKNTI